MIAALLVYDDDCGFCTRSARFVRRHGTVRIVGFSELSPDLESRLPDAYRECAHLVTDESVYSCGEAVERAFERTKLVPRSLFDVLRAVPRYPFLREWVYQQVAENRGRIGGLLP